MEKKKNSHDEELLPKRYSSGKDVKIVEFVGGHVAAMAAAFELLSPNLIRVISFRLKAIVSGFYERKLQEANLDSAGG